MAAAQHRDLVSFGDLLRTTRTATRRHVFGPIGVRIDQAIVAVSDIGSDDGIDGRRPVFRFQTGCGEFFHEIFMVGAVRKDRFARIGWCVHGG